MKLVDDIGIWEAITAYGEGDAPKSAGFRWVRERTRWQAPNALAALELVDYASEADQVRLRADAEKFRAAEEVRQQAEAEKVAAAVLASRATDADISIPASSNLSYLGYQKAGIAYALARRDTLIADEMGLGKTIQALGVMNVDAAKAHVAGRKLSVLVIAPKIALRNWQREAEKWLVNPLSTAIWTSKKQEAADFVVINYDVLARPAVAKAIRARRWDVAVFDEAHALKNEKAARTKAALGSPADGITAIKAGRRLFLTGTPILNRPIELFPVLRAVGFKEAQNYYRFAEAYCEGTNTRWGYDASGACNLEELQTALRSQVMVRRLKSEVLTELPAKRFAVVELDADTPDLRRAIAAEKSAEKAAADQAAKLRLQIARAEKAGDAQALRKAIAELAYGQQAAFTEMSRLRHETAVAKIPQVVEHIAGLLDGSDESILVFAHHTDVIEGIRAGLAEAGHVAAVITGDTSDAARQAAQDDIQAKRRRVFLGSMRACGVAITLTAASTVVFAEQDWTPGIMQQAEDRAHRIGQVNAVLVQHLVVDGSFDSTMAKTVAAKGGVIGEALDAQATEVAVTEQDIAVPEPVTAQVAAEPEQVSDLEVTVLEQDLPVAVPVAAEAVAEPEPVSVPDLALAPDVDDEGYISFDFTDAERALDELDPPDWVAQVAQAGSGVAEAVEVEQAATTAPVTKRGRGRPSLAGAPMSKAERNRRWRAGHGIVALEVPAAVAERLRRLREERGLSNADLLAAALDALAGQQATTPPDTRRLDA
ncbi:MAG: DEAD/DEAH box helicase [Janthinobacterium lividum]